MRGRRQRDDVRPGGVAGGVDLTADYQGRKIGWNRRIGDWITGELSTGCWRSWHLVAKIHTQTGKGKCCRWPERVAPAGLVDYRGIRIMNREQFAAELGELWCRAAVDHGGGTDTAQLLPVFLLLFG